MERILNDNEKIRKAEEIYYRRNNKNISIGEKEYEKNKTYIGSKILLRIVLLLNFIIIFLGVQYRDYIFTKDFLNNLTQYNIDINEKVTNAVNSFFNDNSEINSETNEDTDLNNLNHEELKEIEQNEDSNINETNTDTNIDIHNSEELSSTISQMDIDVQNLKNAYYFNKPINGIVSSSFGARESEYQNVKGYHTGIDIAAERGTIIKASMEGIVTQVSSEGDYRKSYQNSFK